jgi:hypothetical protein
MKKSTRLLVTAAAIAGLYAGAGASRAYAQDAGKSDTSKDASKDSGKHDCKGKNGCAGKGGCKSGDNGCKGKNSCSGKGGCNTNAKDDSSTTTKPDGK